MNIRLGRVGVLRATYLREWDAAVFDRPLVAVVAVKRLMFGFTAARGLYGPYAEVYFGWPGVEFYLDRRPDST